MTVAKRGPGRPAKPARERRTEQLALRLTAAELRECERMAARAGKTVSEWARQLLLTTRPKQKPAHPVKGRRVRKWIGDGYSS